MSRLAPLPKVVLTQREYRKLLDVIYVLGFRHALMEAEAVANGNKRSNLKELRATQRSRLQKFREIAS